MHIIYSQLKNIYIVEFFIYGNGNSNDYGDGYGNGDGRGFHNGYNDNLNNYYGCGDAFREYYGVCELQNKILIFDEK